MKARGVIIAAVVIAVVVPAVFWWRASWIANHLLHSEAPKSIAEKSGGVYRLRVGQVRFNPLRRRIVVDAIQLTTDEELNARRSRPRTVLRLEFHQCTIAGMHVFTLIAARGLIAESFGCGGVSAEADVPAPAGGTDTASAAGTAGQAFFILQQGLRLPRFAPRIEVARIDFPHAELDFRLRRARGGPARLELEHLQWRMTGFTVDPTDSSATSRPLFSRAIDISAASFVAHPDSSTAVRVDGFAASLPDSIVEIRGIVFAPDMSDSAFARLRPYRRSLLKTSISRVTARGFDAGALALGEGLRVRRVLVDSLHIDVLSDRRRPPNPQAPRRRTPQAWIADLDRSVIVDSVLFRDGEVVYREQRAQHPKPGVLTFARLDALALNVRHVGGAGGRTSSRKPMTLRATAYLQNAGRLDAHFVVPLDAPSFQMSFDGALGPMPATRLNAFIEETFAMRLDKGDVLGIGFDADVRRGVAQGTIVPRYKNLSVEVTGRGSKGILATGGVIGDAARGVATLIGNLMEIHADNPDEGDTTPRRGTINHPFTPRETLPAFLWASLRGGLMAVVRK